MDFRFTAEQEAFRQDIQTFLDAELPEPPDLPDDGWSVGSDREFS
jgi:hypothetical protein